MATVAQYRAYEEVLNRVNDVRMRATVCRLLDGLFGAAALASLAVLAVTTVQAAFRFEALGREILRVILIAGLIAAGLRLAMQVLRRQWSDEQAARFIETRVPGTSNHLINVVQLVHQSDRWPAELLDRAMTEAARSVRACDLSRAISWRRVICLAACAAVGVALLATFAWGQPGMFRSALGQVLHPYQFVPSRGQLALEVSPGDVELVRGQPLRVTVRFDDRGGPRRDVLLFTSAADEPSERQLAMTPVGGSAGQYACEVPEVTRPLRYRVEVGRDQSDRYAVSIREKPVLTELTVACEYPKYTGLEPSVVKGATGNIRVPAGTLVTLTVAASGPVKGCTLRFAGRRSLTCEATDGTLTTWRGRWRVFENDAYRLEVNSTEAPAGGDVEYAVEAVADQPPVVDIRLPGREVSVPPGGKVKVLVKVTDDYGLSSVGLFVGPEKQPSAQAAKTWNASDLAGQKSPVLEYTIAIPAEAKLGSIYEYHAEATDNLAYPGGPSPHLARSDTWRIVVQDAKALARSSLKEAQDLYDRLQKLLDSQTEARRWLDSLAALTRDAALSRLHDVAARQKAIRAETLLITQQVTFDQQTANVKTTLDLLSQNQMRQAEETAVRLVEVAATKPDRDMQQALAGLQGEIIVILQRLLDVALARIDAAKVALGQGGADLPADVQDKLKALSEKLREFIDQQKKVIEESSKLAKKPVDDFTAEDKAKLQELAVTEDQWEKFLANAISELSNLPVLDASNASLLKELVEVKVDLEMARDALKKGAVEIAVPLEESGAELAKEIVENLERWLPDTPDRVKWSMEEPLQPMDIPHAELPEQLEDLIGELLEQEEDVFDEMEDATSGWADSLDKGAGWDAMDGPISNYSAKGVTGNQLPNTSEIGGRSGEGRTGKASGEMVEDTATGKGGRRTPTRVTADPYQQGEVKDTSTDSPGGATGGGKVSGSGQEGLEGPVPRETERQMQRLRGKQASIRGQAEKINLDLKVSNFQSFNIDEALRSMRRVERELLAGRYQNALREKHVLLNQLKSTQALLKGEILVRTDVRSDLPDEYRKEIEEAAKAPMPEGYESLVRDYYDRLSGGQ